MATYRIQRKLFDDSDQNQQQQSSGGMGLGTKIALGVGATAAGIGAAKFGVFGAKAQRAVNRQWMNVGNKFGSESMMKSGAEGMAEAQYKTTVKNYKNAINDGKAANIEEIKGKLTNLESEAGKKSFIESNTKNYMNRFNKPSTPAPAPTQAAFSTDTKKELKAAAIAGGGLITLGSGILLAKNGKLGFNKAQREAAKKTYENLTRKLKNTLSEKAPKFENEKKFGGKGKGKKKYYTSEDLGKETTINSPEIDKTKDVTVKPYYKPEDWKKIVNYSKKNKCSTGEAASKLGMKPVPPKPPKK